MPGIVTPWTARLSSGEARAGVGTSAGLLVLVLLLISPTSSGVTASTGGSPQPVRAAGHALIRAATGSNASAQNWTMFMGDAEHNATQSNGLALNATTAGQLKLQWTFLTGGVIAAQPVILGNDLFIGSWDGNEYSLFANNGTMRWATYTGQSYCLPSSHRGTGITSTASLADGEAYVGGGGAYWDAMNQSTGKVDWSTYVGNNATGPKGGYYNWGSGIVDGNYLYFGTSSHCDDPLVQGQVLKYDLTTHLRVGVFNTTPRYRLGATVWSTPAMNPVSGELFIATGNLYPKQGTNSTWDDSIIGVGSANMGYIGHYQVPYAQRYPDGDFGASPTLFHTDTGVPMVGDTNKNGIFYALAQKNLKGGPIWTFPVATNLTYGSAAFANNSIFVGGANTVISGTKWGGSIRSLNATTGAVQWARGFGGQVFGSLTYTDGLIIGAPGRNLVVLSATTGKTLFAYSVPYRFYGSPSVANGRIYIGGTDGMVYCFGLPLNAAATATPTNGTAPLFVNFHVTAWGGGQGYRYLWNFGDNTTGSASGFPSHVYNAAGNYSVVVNVTDQNTNVVSRYLTIVVTEPLAPVRGRPRSSAPGNPID